MYPHLGRATPVLAIPKRSAFNFSQSWEQPDVESVVKTTGHNHRSLGPLFPSDHAISPCYIDPLRFGYSEAANAAYIATKHVYATASVEIPDTNSLILRTADEEVLRCG